MEQPTVRLLNADDAAQYRSVRLAALAEHPEAFGSSAAEFEQQSLDEVAKRLSTQSEAFSLFGAFLAGKLMGLIGFGRHSGQKVRHRGGIYHMYVAPEVRGRGLGWLLVGQAVGYARQRPGLEEIILAVTVGNDPAYRLYERFGFVFSHREPRYIKIDDRYYDIDWMILGLR